MYEEVLSRVDYTLLKQTAGWSEVRKICDDAVSHGVVSVCIPPSFAKRVAECLDGRMKVCTVAGFPNEYNTTAVKWSRAEDAIANGADEIDMVVSLGDVRDSRWGLVREETALLKRCCGDKVLKVIVEACLLTEEEKVGMCAIVTETGADHIRASTGFAGGGATFEDVALFTHRIGKHTGVKAAGDIDSLKVAEHFIELGVSRLGTSRVIRIIKKQDKGNGGV